MAWQQQQILPARLIDIVSHVLERFAYNSIDVFVSVMTPWVKQTINSFYDIACVSTSFLLPFLLLPWLPQICLQVFPPPTDVPYDDIENNKFLFIISTRQYDVISFILDYSFPRLRSTR